MTLTVLVEGPGEVSVPGTGLQCEGSCKWALKSGSTVHLDANPDDKASFADWSGACERTARCDLVIAQDVQVRARFVLSEESSPTPTVPSTIPPIPLEDGEWSELQTESPSCAPATETQVCTPGCFCWENPRPHGHGIFSVVATLRGTYFGVSGGILRWDGVRFVHEAVPNGFYARLSAVGEEVWAAGGDIVLRFDGSGWSAVAPPTEREASEIFAAAPGEAWIVGQGAFRWRDGRWENMNAPGRGFEWIGGTSPTDVWVANSANVYQFDGARWIDRTPGNGKQLINFGVSPDGVAANLEYWVYGHHHTLTARWNGEEWVEVSGPPSMTVHFDLRLGLGWAFGSQSTPDGPRLSAFRSVEGGWEALPLEEVAWVGRVGGEVLAYHHSGYLARLEGNRFVRMTPAMTPSGVGYPSRIGKEDWAVGERNQVVAWDGVSLRNLVEVPFRARLLAAAPEGTAWVAGLDELAHIDGARVLETLSNPAPNDILAIAVTDSGALWLRPDGGPLWVREPGASWQMETVAGLSDDDWISGHAAAGDEVWVGTSQALFRHSEGVWHRESGPPCLKEGECYSSGLHATGAQDVWLETTSGVFHYDGATWTRITPSGYLQVSGRDAVWVKHLGLGSGRPDVAYWNGVRWAPLRIAGYPQLSSAGGSLTAFTGGGRLRHRPAPLAP